MNKLKMLVICMAALSSMKLFASEGSTSIDQKLNSLRMERLQAENIIDKMHRSGRMNNEEAQRAKREIASVKEDDVEKEKALAVESLDSKTSFATK